MKRLDPRATQPMQTGLPKRRRSPQSHRSTQVTEIVKVTDLLWSTVSSASRSIIT